MSNSRTNHVSRLTGLSKRAASRWLATNYVEILRTARVNEWKFREAMNWHLQNDQSDKNPPRPSP